MQLKDHVSVSPGGVRLGEAGFNQMPLVWDCDVPVHILSASLLIPGVCCKQVLTDLDLLSTYRVS